MLSGLKHFIRRNLAPESAQWPFVRGDYTVVDASAPVVVMSSYPTELTALADSPPVGLCMTAALHSADEAADLCRALAANLAVQFVICLESETAKRPLATAVLKLGNDDKAQKGDVGALMNTIASQLDVGDLDELRRRVEFVDLLSCRDTAKIVARVELCRAAASQPNAGFVKQTTDTGVPRLVLPRHTRNATRADKAGHFTIRLEEQSIVVEHLNGKNRLLRLIEGKTARDICLALIRNGWISKLDHAAYLGRELARAELALQSGRPYTQDSAEPSDPLQAARPES